MDKLVEVIVKYYPLFLTGIKITALLALCTVFIGVILGMFVALMRLSKLRVLRIISSAYVEFLRGTPLLVQIYIIYFGLQKVIVFPDIPFVNSILGINFGDFMAGVITLSINSSAYVAEIIRAGIQAVDKGQMEAARSLGLTHVMAMRHIIIPQAFRNILPALGNELVVMIKESSIVSVIGVGELMKQSRLVQSKTYLPFEPLIIAAVLYFIMTFTLSKIMGKVERRMRAGDRS